MAENPLVPATKLDAVNGMLRSIGHARVNTLDVPGISPVNDALGDLSDVTREVLMRGWSFNTDDDYPLAPDANGNIPIPASAAHVDPQDPYINYVQRSNSGTMMLYDKTNRTFTIKKAVPCEIIWLFDFDEVPQCARTYIATRAARIFQSNQIGSKTLFQFTELHENEAYATLQKLEGRTSDLNMLNTPTETNLSIYHRLINPYR